LKVRAQIRAKDRGDQIFRLARLSCPRRISLLILAATVALLCAAPRLIEAQSGPTSEYKVKAAFLYNLARFVDWPPESLPNDHSPIIIGVLGKDPFGSALDEIILRKSINGHSLQIARAKSIQELKLCQIVFVSSSEDKRIPEILASLQGTNILTVGESENFMQLGGAVQLTLLDNRLRFAINVDVARRARLKFSSKLLSLARVVRDEAGQGKN
jgi:hypothetical protein